MPTFWVLPKPCNSEKHRFAKGRAESLLLFNYLLQSLGRYPPSLLDLAGTLRPQFATLQGQKTSLAADYNLMLNLGLVGRGVTNFHGGPRMVHNEMLVSMVFLFPSLLAEQ